MTTQQLLRPASPPPDALVRVLAGPGSQAAGESVRGTPDAGTPAPRLSLPKAGDVVRVDLPALGRARGARAVQLHVRQAVWVHRRPGRHRKCWIDGQVLDASGEPIERHVLLVRVGEFEPVQPADDSQPAASPAER